MKTALRWTITLAALLMLGPAAGGLVHSLNSPGGLDTVTLLHNTSPVMGVVALAGVTLLAVIPAGVIAAAMGLRPALTTAGLVFAWAAWMLGRGDWLLRAEPSTGTLTTLALEGLLVAAALVVVLFVLDTVAGRAGQRDQGHIGISLKSTIDSKALMAAGAAAVAAGAVAWIIAQHGLRGQAIFAAFCGSIAAGVAGRLVVSSTGDQGETPSPWPDYLGVALVMIAGPLVGLIRPGAGGLEVAAVDGTLPGLLRVFPLDWAVGAVFGVPLGHAWVGGASQAAERSGSPRAA